MKPEISIIVPAHNEESNIAICVSELVRVCKQLDYEIVLVDDASKDKTPAIVNYLGGKNKNIKVVHRKPPNGFGRAVKTGLSKASGDIIVFVMADLSDDPHTVPKLVQKIKDGYDIAIGSRFVHGGKVIDYPLSKYIAHRIYNKVVGLVFRAGIQDFSNAFKAYRRSVLENIDVESNGFEITAELILKAIVLKKAKIVEVPTTWRNRKKGKAKFTGLYMQGMKYGKIFLRCLELRLSQN